MVKRATIHVSSRTKKNHPKYGGIRRIKRPTQQAASKQHDTTLDALHLRIKKYTVMNKNNKTNNGNENHGSHCHQMSDGTFDFVPRTKPKSRSVLIRKLAHGRRSRTQDDVLQLTLKFFRTENVVIAQAIMDEAQDAIDALLNEQLTK